MTDNKFHWLKTDIIISEQKEEWGIVRSFVVEYVYLDKFSTQVFIDVGLFIKNVCGTRSRRNKF